MKLTLTMKAALAYAAKYGDVLDRYPGGYWFAKAAKPLSRWDEHYGTPTIEALVTRGKMTYTKWQERDPRPPFPIQATIVRSDT